MGGGSALIPNKETGDPAGDRIARLAKQSFRRDYLPLPVLLAAVLGVLFFGVAFLVECFLVVCGIGAGLGLRTAGGRSGRGLRGKRQRHRRNGESDSKNDLFHGSFSPSRALPAYNPIMLPIA
ncbi:hypothetical protein SBA3_1260036 [Candidatus Sulfopaludibacter sp. SbA3]|nr:hypothetical protein SBA3_1260036 [Candidatus Sulfopaludibacter sp. SbA3]